MIPGFHGQAGLSYRRAEARAAAECMEATGQM
jgi:hypothetical protein